MRGRGRTPPRACQSGRLQLQAQRRAHVEPRRTDGSREVAALDAAEPRSCRLSRDTAGAGGAWTSCCIEQMPSADGAAGRGTGMLTCLAGCGSGRATCCCLAGSCWWVGGVAGGGAELRRKLYRPYRTVWTHFLYQIESKLCNTVAKALQETYKYENKKL